LAQNYPNPFNPSTTIAFTLAAETHVEVTIYDAAGTRVRTLVDERRAGGEYQVPWDGRTDRGGVAASGVYFYRLKTPGVTETRRMVLLR
jgi:flagellar hook assembly protein FlgD